MKPTLEGGGGGSRGICIFVRSGWQATERSFPNCAFQEQLWISIPLQNWGLLLVGWVYRSPSADVNTSTDNLINLLHTASDGKHTHLLVAVDINCRKSNGRTVSHVPLMATILTDSLKASKSVD